MRNAVLLFITVVLTAAMFFCAGMRYAITHMTIDLNTTTDTAYVTLHNNVYVHTVMN